jgi:Na+/melibiose symporter-like transporter
MAEIQAQYCEKVYETSTVPHHIETSTVQRMSADLGANGLFKNGTLNGKAVSLVDTPESSITWTRLLVLFAGLALCVFLCSLDQTVVATAIPRIASDLGGLAHVAWIGSAYLLAAVAVTPLYGRLTGIFGIKQVFLSALFMFLIGSLGCGLSSSILMLIVFRIVAGIGGESIYALSLIIITSRLKYC